MNAGQARSVHALRRGRAGRQERGEGINVRGWNWASPGSLQPPLEHVGFFEPVDVS